MKFHGETIEEVIKRLENIKYFSTGKNGELDLLDYRYKSAVYGEITIQNGEVEESCKNNVGNGIF